MRSFLANFKKVLAQGGGHPLPDPPPSVAARPRMSPEFEQLLGWQHWIYIDYCCWIASSVFCNKRNPNPAITRRKCNIGLSQSALSISRSNITLRRGPNGNTLYTPSTLITITSL